MDGDRQKLIAAARRLLDTRADAEDAVQDAYLRACVAPPSSPESRSAWLHTVLRRIAIDRLRRRRREAPHRSGILPGPDPACEDDPRVDPVWEGQSECLAALRHLLRRVTAADAALVLLHTVFEFEHAEIAAVAGKSEAALRQCLHRALARARRAEGPDAPAEDEDRYVGLCWQAIESRDSAVLFELLAAPAMAQAIAVPARPAIALGLATARASTILVHVNGRYALALVLDGIILCTVPVGTAQRAAFVD